MLSFQNSRDQPIGSKDEGPWTQKIHESKMFKYVSDIRV